jgi:hypothetical protein
MEILLFGAFSQRSFNEEKECVVCVHFEKETIFVLLE